MQLKKQIISIFFAMTTLFIASLGYAASAANDLMQYLGNMHSLQANFQQTITDKNSKVIQRSYGRMAMQRPGKFRWEVKSPVAQVIIANGERLWIYDPDLAQVTIKSLTKAAGEAPALLLTNPNSDLERNFNIEKQDGANMTWFLLTPQSRGSVFASIQLGFANHTLRQMVMKDNLGQTTQVQFENVKQDAAIPSGSFIFSPPPKVDVIDETKPGSRLRV